MYKQALYLSLLLSSSQMVVAKDFYQPEPRPHHEMTSGGIGLVLGAMAGGPIGAFIGGSMGVMTGNNQTKSETITEQHVSIQQLEADLSTLMTTLSEEKLNTRTAQHKVRQLEQNKQFSSQQHRADLMAVINSYQLDIHFTTKNHAISEHSLDGLNKLAQLLHANPHINAHLEAHSDWRGTESENYLLATKRLDAVYDILLLSSVDDSKIISTNYGENLGINKGSYGEALFFDRRVTITLSYFE
ncbi:MAG: hypothetical protein COA90_04770 [Gammaproteobacteria bacterium]|nr:MAG: hypothetical protein COA90_04770 [Gammaproteobacteria bacterium]